MREYQCRRRTRYHDSRGINPELSKLAETGLLEDRLADSIEERFAKRKAGSFC